ncbi:MAG TPA: SDR family oxidoreductase [Thermoanaerobaculia bacterium]|nr:SDR family oxidoreductase [Thermoanaerobaculia bacterium]
MHGKIAIVTGASSGIGLATATRLAALGVRVALVARREALLADAIARIGAERAAAFPLDVRQVDALQALPHRVIEHFGALDIVVNNAGVNHRGPIASLAVPDLVDVLATNLTAPVVLCRAAAPLMRAGGSIVNVASIAGMIPVHDEAAYSASKAGLRAFSRVVREEMMNRGIRVSLVSPGPVDTAFFDDVESVPDLVFSQPMSTAEDVTDAIIRAIREGPEEIAIPAMSARLAAIGYLSTRVANMVRPMLERRGARNKRAYLARRA